MTQYIDKSALIAEIERLKECNRKICAGDFDFLKKSYPEHYYSTEIYNDILSFIDTLEVKEVETPVIPKHSYVEEIYHCGSEPRFKIGDVLAVYEFCSDYEGEYIYGKITDVKMDFTKDWCYTFENGDIAYENGLISDEAYKKN